MCWISPRAIVGGTAYAAITLGSVSACYLLGWIGPAFSLFNGTTIFGGATIASGVWFHAAMTNSATSGSNFLGYYNGALNITGTSVTLSPTGFEVGDDSVTAGSDFAIGNIAAIKAWNRVLTQQEILAEMPYALPVNRAGLNSCYPVPSGWDVLPSGITYPRSALTRWADWSGNGLEWTETGIIDMETGPPIG